MNQLPRQTVPRGETGSLGPRLLVVAVAGLAVAVGVLATRDRRPPRLARSQPGAEVGTDDREPAPYRSTIDVGRDDRPRPTVWKRDPATWTGRPEDVPERYRPQEWTQAVVKVDQRLKRNQAGITGKAVYTDCSEMPCISYFSLEGFETPAGKEPAVDDKGHPNPQATAESTRIQRELIERSSKYFDEVTRDALGDYGRGAAPFVEIVSSAPGKVQVAITYMPVDNEVHENGVPVKPDPELQSRLQKRMAVHWQ